MWAANYFLPLAFFSASASSCARFLLPATQPSLRATPNALSSVHPCVTPAASRVPLRPRLNPSALASSLSFGIGHSWFWADESAREGSHVAQKLGQSRTLWARSLT